MSWEETVCAVVVTYNRKELLIECLEALRKQTRPLQGIYLIDNASTDGTPEFLKEKGYISQLPPKSLKEPWEKEFNIYNLTNGNHIKIHYVRMHENTGGAGGFHEGVKRAYKKGYDWLWLMDDDTIPENNTLEELLNSKIILDNLEIEFGFISSSVLWKDKTFHRMNLPVIYKEFDLMRKVYEKGLLPLKSSSFVSLLINKNKIEKYGLPYKDFFIWNDDVEYTLRISKNSPGFLSFKSVVIHKTEKNYTPISGVNPDRFFYEVRNKIWLLKTDSLNMKDRIKIIFILIYNILLFLKKSFSLKKIFIISKGLIKGIFSRPCR